MQGRSRLRKLYSHNPVIRSERFCSVRKECYRAVETVIETASPARQMPVPNSENWLHDLGVFCITMWLEPRVFHGHFCATDGANRQGYHERCQMLPVEAIWHGPSPRKLSYWDYNGWTRLDIWRQVWLLMFIILSPELCPRSIICEFLTSNNQSLKPYRAALTGDSLGIGDCWAWMCILNLSSKDLKAWCRNSPRCTRPICQPTSISQPGMLIGIRTVSRCPLSLLYRSNVQKVCRCHGC